MLTKVSFENFSSFDEETEISFEIKKKASKSYFDTHIPENRIVNKVIACFGANGAGKTHMLRSISFLSWFISNSAFVAKHHEKIPLSRHHLSEKAVSKFAIEFVYNDEFYRYKLEATEDRVIHESLHKKTSHLYSYIFTRDFTNLNDGYDYKQKDFGFTGNLAKKVRGNASIICAAAMHDIEFAVELVDYYNKYISNIFVTGRQYYTDEFIFEAAQFLNSSPKIKDEVSNLICNFDLGINSIEYKEGEQADQQGNTQKVITPVASHQSERGKFTLPLFAESSGTKSAFVLLTKILPVLDAGGMAIIDEIDNDLHPHMIPAIIELFKFKETNPHNAQLIFTCHSPEVLNLLKKHQIYLVEKVDLFSEAWRLDEVEGLRSDDNIYAKYQSGALGAIPNI